LEKKRRCGWIEDAASTPPMVVWARNVVSVTSCPTSYITPESIGFLEEFHAWKLFGATDLYKLPARLVDAIFVLENELRSERNDAQN
jgi:hypothetical protein